MQYEDEIIGKGAEEKSRKNTLSPNTSIESVGAGRSSLLLLRDIGIAVVIIIVILQFFKPTIVFERSMENTLHPQDYVLLSRQAYTFSDVEHGDIVVFKSTLKDDRGQFKNLIKRVIGLPGDVLEVKDGAVYRNGVRLVEPYTKDGYTSGRMSPVTVPEGKVFIMGDNREVSTDSRSAVIGTVPINELEGKVFFVLLPISRAGGVR